MNWGPTNPMLVAGYATVKKKKKRKESQCMASMRGIKRVLVCSVNKAGGLPCSSNSKESACDAGDQGSIPGSGRGSRDRNGNPLQYSCLEKSMDREAWRATIRGVAKRHDWATNTHTHRDTMTHPHTHTQWHTHTHTDTHTHTHTEWRRPQQDDFPQSTTVQSRK